MMDHFEEVEAEEAQLELQRRAEELAEVQRVLDLQSVLDTSAGRAVLWDILCQADLYRGGFVDNPHLVSYNEGKRVIGTTLYERIYRARPDIDVTMRREAEVRRKQLETSLNA